MKDNRFTRWLFSVIYRKWLWNDLHKTYNKVAKVKGWRSALIDSPSGQRKDSTMLFRIYKNIYI